MRRQSWMCVLSSPPSPPLPTHSPGTSVLIFLFLSYLPTAPSPSALKLASLSSSQRKEGSSSLTCYNRSFPIPVASLVHLLRLLPRVLSPGSSQLPFPSAGGWVPGPCLVRKKQANSCDCFQIFECVKDGLWAMGRGQGALHIHRMYSYKQSRTTKASWLLALGPTSPPPLTWHLSGPLQQHKVASFLFF